MSGWLRLWILTSGIYACSAGWLAVETWPTQQNVEFDWVLEGTNLIAKAVSSDRGVATSRYEVEEKLRETRDDQQLLEYFRKFASHPTEAQRSISVDMAIINERFDGSLPEPVRRHMVSALLSITIPIIALFGLGYGVGWVVQGFKRSKRKSL